MSLKANLLPDLMIRGNGKTFISGLRSDAVYVPFTFATFRWCFDTVMREVCFLQLAIHFTNHSYKNSFTIKDRHKTSLSDDFDMIVIMWRYIYEQLNVKKSPIKKEEEATVCKIYKKIDIYVH